MRTVTEVSVSVTSVGGVRVYVKIAQYCTRCRKLFW